MAPSPLQGIDVTAQLNHLLMPIDRGERYEDPLEAALSARGLGEITGGGTSQHETGEIEYIDINVTLTNADRGVPFLIESLEALGAPKGSKLHLADNGRNREIPFGMAEGVAVYLDGISLPKEVYETSDVNVLIEQLNEALEGIGEMQSYWEGRKETALYFYGRDADAIKAGMRAVLTSYPLCAGARVVTIAPLV